MPSKISCGSSHTAVIGTIEPPGLSCRCWLAPTVAKRVYDPCPMDASAKLVYKTANCIFDGVLHKLDPILHGGGLKELSDAVKARMAILCQWQCPPLQLPFWYSSALWWLMPSHFI
ncbi:hypothetical protein Pint_17213 [Pistacia integerrima]|uniref:Uncharacterized protein n=1 Tax=Pistacia integerrima TaxID=434235 RepID=A0ACC0YYK9_9ROSI|nr:hypothetical protein Pint_17213 [Pistacia integerrima]